MSNLYSPSLHCSPHSSARGAHSTTDHRQTNLPPSNSSPRRSPQPTTAQPAPSTAWEGTSFHSALCIWITSEALQRRSDPFYPKGRQILARVWLVLLFVNRFLREKCRPPCRGPSLVGPKRTALQLPMRNEGREANTVISSKHRAAAASSALPRHECHATPRHASLHWKYFSSRMRT